MENGSIRAGQVDEYSLSTWIAINFDRIPQDVVVALMPNGDELDEVLPPIEEPERDDFESEEEYLAKVSEWEEEVEMQEESRGLPLWGTMWVASHSDDVVEDLCACGFDVFIPQYGTLADCYEGCVLFGVNGGGYSFAGSHWIPLRASRVFRSFTAGYLPLEELETVFAKLLEESRREGEQGTYLQRLLDQARASNEQ